MERNNEYLIRNGFAKGNEANSTSFKKGNIPWNKGKRGIRLSPLTEFKKGCESKKKLPIGTVTIRHRKREKHPRAWIKVGEPNVWKPNAIYVWESHNGRIPKGYTIHHIDRNPLNDSISNLSMLTRAQHLEEHRAEYKK
jgi:hypothetical protein